MLTLFFILLLGIAVLLESSIITMPFTIGIMLLFFVLTRKDSAFFLAVFAGIFLDIYAVRAIGITSLFLIVFLLLISIYEKKFEIKTVPFIVSASFIGSMFFLLFFGGEYMLIQSILMAISVGLIFFLLTRILPKKEASYYDKTI